MGTKVTSSSGSVLEEPEIQKLQMQAKIFKENSLNKLNALKLTTQLLEKESILYQQAFAQLFGDSFRTFKFQLSQHMNNLETLLNAETLHEMDSKSALSVIKLQFERFINSDLLKPLDIYSRSFSSDQEEVDELESEKADFSNIYDLLLEECVSKDVTCSYLHSLSDLNANTELQCLWVPTGKLLNSCTGKVDSEPAHGSIVDIPHIHACKQTLGLSAGTSFNGQKQQRIDLNADALYNEKQENLRVCIQGLVPSMLMTFNTSKIQQNKIAVQASCINGNDVEHRHSSLGRQCKMASAENNTSGPVPQSSKAV
ncbi:hypothetical protein Tco_0859361 [Tanacetum coccineum]|uniref:Uncharacterized protein n=1 Tax=Tanacetum coccineum TaxID=301880 RepID=A0ABQ5BDI2_9ASTR